MMAHLLVVWAFLLAGSSLVIGRRASSPPLASRGPDASRIRRSLPAGNILLAYATSCNVDHVVQRARDGVNVISWFAANLVHSTEGNVPAIQFSQQANLQCIADVVNKLEDKHLPTAHLLCIGGWDAPHPDPRHNGTAYFAAFDAWNRANAERYGFRGFDGVDWDLEGNDDVTSPYNTFSYRTLNIVAEFSTAAKAEGYLIALVPPESYLEPILTSDFDRRVNMTPVVPWHQKEDGTDGGYFPYAGRNVYAYWLATCPPDTYDLISVQLYESWSYAGYSTEQLGMTVDDFLVDFVNQWRTTDGLVRFSHDPGLGMADTKLAEVLPRDYIGTRMLVGFSFGSVDGKQFFAYPEQVGRAWETMGGGAPRGIFYWNMDMDPMSGPNGTDASNVVYLTQGFNNFLQVRRVDRQNEFHEDKKVEGSVLFAWILCFISILVVVAWGVNYSRRNSGWNRGCCHCCWSRAPTGGDANVPLLENLETPETDATAI